MLREKSVSGTRAVRDFFCPGQCHITMILWCDHDDENLGSHGHGHGENDNMTCT